MHNYKFLPYDKNLISVARDLRKKPTEAELKFWSEVLKNKKFESFKFTCQKPIDFFIVDFYCSKLALVIEIDGEVHQYQQARDRERDNILKEKYNLKVLRYSNKEVLENTDLVLKDLLKYVTETP